jgi:hypothetical protein
MLLEQGLWRLVGARQESAEVATSHWRCLNPPCAELVKYVQFSGVDCGLLGERNTCLVSLLIGM